jgi:hypothetical protein
LLNGLNTPLRNFALHVAFGLEPRLPLVVPFSCCGDAEPVSSLGCVDPHRHLHNLSLILLVVTLGYGIAIMASTVHWLLRNGQRQKWLQAQPQPHARKRKRRADLVLLRRWPGLTSTPRFSVTQPSSRSNDNRLANPITKTSTTITSSKPITILFAASPLNHSS